MLSLPRIQAKHRQSVPPTVLLPRRIWKPDFLSQSCDSPQCMTSFGFLERKHHCRKCGKIFCGKCSSHVAPLLDISCLNQCAVLKTSVQELSRRHRATTQDTRGDKFLPLLTVLLNPKFKNPQRALTAPSPCDIPPFDNNLLTLAPQSTTSTHTATLSSRSHRLECFDSRKPHRISGDPFRVLFKLFDPEAINKSDCGDRVPSQENDYELDDVDAEFLENVVEIGGIIRWAFTRNPKAKPVVFYGFDPDNLSSY
ncbi:hypothetical protein CVT26_012347 [Gymnopilus dilepis]|uniref:FYVE-type domain-containing protein n=1 Tax=Gymnopilus dilepis TaxID=231916 RepID=A0A409YQ33_9AGAR|nr:hypothetical protein CVT26_012347 [Gymnopilus dilepis]